MYLIKKRIKWNKANEYTDYTPPILRGNTDFIQRNIMYYDVNIL